MPRTPDFRLQLAAAESARAAGHAVALRFSALICIASLEGPGAACIRSP